MTTADLRVVMMVANDVTNDSRVRKEAAALAETGAEVTVLGVSDSGLPSRELLDGALIVRVAVPFSLREERKRSRTARRDWRPPLVGYRYRSTYVARSQRRTRVSQWPGRVERPRLARRRRQESPGT